MNQSQATENKSKLWVANHKGWLLLGAKIALLAVVVWVIFGVCFGMYRISGPAMSPRLQDGDLILYSRIAGQYGPGDVVLYEHAGATYVSAIIASGGDLIEIDNSGYLRLNGAQISQAVAVTPEQQGDITSTYRVPTGSFFMLNENLDSMEDSRTFGAIYEKDIKGKIVGLLRTRSI